MLCLYTISHLRKTMSVFISKVNKSVKFIIALGIFALILSFSNHIVKADTFYPTWFRGYTGVLTTPVYTYSPVSSTNDYLSYSVYSSYPYFYTSYSLSVGSTLNMLVNHNSIGGSSCSFIYTDSSGSVVLYSLNSGSTYSLVDYYGNSFSICYVGSTLTVTGHCNSDSVFNFGFYFGDDISSGTLTIYNSYYLSGDSSSSSTDYTSLLSSIYNQLVALNTDTDTMISYLNTIINNLVSLNADSDTIISELNTIESLIGSTSDSGTILYYLYQISTYTSYTPNIYSLLNAWYQDLVSESEDTSIDEEIESDLAVVEAQVGDSVSAASSSQSDMLSADSDVDDSIQSGFDNFDSNIDSITDNISLTSGTGLYSSFGIFSLLFSDVFGISEINTYLYILLFLGIIGTVFGVASKVIGKRGDSGD